MTPESPLADLAKLVHLDLARASIDERNDRIIECGQHSIRINDQWRVCFYWTEQGAMEIEITDYH